MVKIFSWNTSDYGMTFLRLAKFTFSRLCYLSPGVLWSDIFDLANIFQLLAIDAQIAHFHEDLAKAMSRRGDVIDI